MSMRNDEKESSGRQTPELQDGPPLVAPLHFRPNSLFVGFQMELDELHERLNARKRNELGTRCVLIWGQPGCGKTYLARQFFYQYRQDYTSGTFWVDCKSTESILSSYWDIAISIGVSPDEQDTNTSRRSSESFVDSVRKKLENMAGWLIVFDGIVFDTEEEISIFQRYVPDRTGNCIIYTSVDSTLRGRQRLLEPVAVKVRPLSRDEASKLLFKNLGIQHPSPLQRSKAANLVKDYQCLPLGIHAAAHALIEKGRALDTYTHTLTDSRLTSPFLDILSALYEKSHVEALNLINLLSFFNHTIPVQLLQYGAKSLDDFQLDIMSPKRLVGGRKDLDNTIAILIRSGLLERSLQVYSVNSPSDGSPEGSRSSTKRIDTPAQEDSNGLAMILPGNGKVRSGSPPFQSMSTIDVLHVNSMVQNVIREDLKDRDYSDNNREYWWWLTVAVHLLSSSFAIAQDRIKRTPTYGLVRDYREYHAQVARLWSFFPKSSRKASNELRKSRHELHEIWRMIKQEIRSQSPSESSTYSGQLLRNSIFERASVSSDAETQSSISDLTRASTWSLDPTQTESPTDLETDLRNQTGLEDDIAVHSDTDSWTSQSDTTEIPMNTLAERSRRSSALRAIFQGNPNQARKYKDLGEWKPMPAPPSVSHPDVQVAQSRSTSRKGSDERQTRQISSGSEAEAALAAVHRFSPPASRGGRIRSPSRGLNSGDGRKPLSSKSGNAQLSPLATEFQPNQGSSAFNIENRPKSHLRQPSTSPRLAQALLINRARSIAGNQLSSSLPMEYSDVASVHRSADQAEALRPTDFGVSGVPTGYTSVPMSREVSEDSGYIKNSGNHLKTKTTQRVFSDSQLPRQAQFVSASYPDSRETYEESDTDRGRKLEFGQQSNPSFGTSPITPVFPSFEHVIDDRYHNVIMANAAEVQDSNSYNAVQFGAMDPVELEAARQRASIARAKSADRGKGRLRNKENRNT